MPSTTRAELPFLVMDVHRRRVARRSHPAQWTSQSGKKCSASVCRQPPVWRAAHAQGLVHRDIKPSNILLENGVERVKITDFGLARVIHEAQLTQTNAVAGTPQYMSPEQARGEPVDHRSDLFSLGCVMYAMCVRPIAVSIGNAHRRNPPRLSRLAASDP